jgi:hypothetical protein
VLDWSVVGARGGGSCTFEIPQADAAIGAAGEHAVDATDLASAKGREEAPTHYRPSNRSIAKAFTPALWVRGCSPSALSA